MILNTCNTYLKNISRLKNNMITKCLCVFNIDEYWKYFAQIKNFVKIIVLLLNKFYTFCKQNICFKKADLFTNEKKIKLPSNLCVLLFNIYDIHILKNSLKVQKLYLN